MLSGKGFKKVFNMSGGINAWAAQTAVGPQDFGMELFEDLEDPLHILITAYSLEQGLQAFYTDLGRQADSQKVRELFLALSRIEVKHMASIYAAYCEVNANAVSQAELEEQVEITALEGGLSIHEYMARFGSDLKQETQVISMAMSIEAQALDLYQRLSLELSNPVSRKIVSQIADEEKNHLASLGRLMDNIQ